MFLLCGFACSDRCQGESAWAYMCAVASRRVIKYSYGLTIRSAKDLSHLAFCLPRYWRFVSMRRRVVDGRMVVVTAGVVKMKAADR